MPAPSETARNEGSLPASRRTHTTAATTVCRYLRPASALSFANASMAQLAMQSAKAQVETRSFSAFRTATRLGGGVVLAAGFDAGFEERRQRSTSTRAAIPSSAAVAVSADGERILEDAWAGALRGRRGRRGAALVGFQGAKKKLQEILGTFGPTGRAFLRGGRHGGAARASP